MIVKVGVSIGRQGCKILDQIEVDDEATEEQIELEVREWALDKVEFWHERTSSEEASDG